MRFMPSRSLLRSRSPHLAQSLHPSSHRHNDDDDDQDQDEGSDSDVHRRLPFGTDQPDELHLRTATSGDHAHQASNHVGDERVHDHRNNVGPDEKVSGLGV